MEPILEIAALKKYYGKEPNLTRALDGISFQVMPGEFLGIMGSSGSGKSTLLNCIATVIAPTGGAVALHGKCITTLHGKALADYRGKEIGYLFQNFELIDNLTGRENILLPLALHSVSETESRARLQKLADYLEVTDVLDKFPAQMSGGQKQRIAAARALILDPEIVLADEPTGALDSKNARSLMEKLSGLNADAGTTILMVTHDCNAASYCKRILFIQDGVLFHELRRDVPGRDAAGILRAHPGRHGAAGRGQCECSLNLLHATAAAVAGKTGCFSRRCSSRSSRFTSSSPCRIRT